MPELSAPELTVAVLTFYLCLRLWARWARNRHSLADLLEAPWWKWPLARYVIRKWKREAHKDLWEYCGMVSARTGDRQYSHGYITISGWHWVAWHTATILGRKVPYTWRLERRTRIPWVKVRVARGFPQGDDEEDVKAQQNVVNNAKGTLDLGPVDYRWHWRLVASHVVITPKEVVPSKALGMAPDVAAVVAANLAADRVVPAIGKGDRPITHSTIDDAAHVLLSGTTMGGGKSETLKTFGLQSYAPSILSGRDIPGADLLIVDTVRKFSHTGWAIDYDTGQPWPGIVIATELDQAAYWITFAGQAMEARGEETRREKTKGNSVDWSRLLILLDDVNGLMKKFRDHGYDKALTQMSQLLWHARGVNMYIVAAFQRGSAIAAGGGDNREAYGGRIWADGSEKTGDMLADAVDKRTRPKPKPHKVQPGHAVFIYGSEAFEAQRIMYLDDEARRICRMEARRRSRRGIEAPSWVRENIRPEGDGGTEGSGVTLPDPQRQLHATHRPPTIDTPARSGLSLTPGDESSMQPMDVISAIDENDGEINYLTLRDLARRDWCPYTYHSIRTYANDKDLDFPAPIEGFSNPRRWSESAVRTWVEDYSSGGGTRNWGVYIVRLPGAATVKIGFTGNLRGRLKAWNVDERVVLRWFPCASRKDARSLEAAKHREYRRYHDHLEWFRIEGKLARDLDLSEVHA